MRILHQNDFPLGENLIALLMLSLADLSQDQRNTLTSLMTHRGRVLQQYTTTELRTVFIEMFCTTKTSVDNPLMQPAGAGGRRSFLVLDEGELDGTFGYWAEDEEDGTEGFLDALDDVFWVYDEQNFSWFQRRFQGRRARKGKGKGRRKGKEKEDQAADFSDLEEKEKERDEVKAIMLMSNRQLIQKSIMKRILMRTLGSQIK